jgi:chromate transporter
MHVGAASAAASLRGRLVEQRLVDEAQFDQCFAVARLTPGTNLLALFALLGSNVAGWRGALVALAVGTVVPSLIATVIAAVYVRHASAPLVVYAMAGAKAAALAVFLWAVVRLSRPVLRQQQRRGLAFTAVVATVAVTGYVPPFVLLIGAGALGAWLLRPPS